jgi:ubiquinone/menaquinone biosynthesis C-methylase UbiE
MNTGLKDKLKPDINLDIITIINEIPVLLNKKFISGDNEKFMGMYNWISHGYDIAETIIGKIKYGNEIDKMRNEMMQKLEWKDNISVLYVSIGTGKDLQFIPNNIDKTTLNIFGVDISSGMLKKCKKKFKRTRNLSLVNCCAEDLPFKDNSFDIVFHVGGINFFNDKQLAISEMVRVAKPNTKLLIADETRDYIDVQYKKGTFSKKYFKDKTFDLKALAMLIPADLKEQQTDLLWNNKFYCITFRK